jgi:acyl-CoA synthetase (AMP-forming)/AMP-acid ligase II
MLIAAPLFHTWGLSMLQVCFALGGTVVLRRKFEPVDTYQALGQYRCNSLVAVPVMLQRILELHAPVPALRAVVSSGSALPGGLANRFMDSYGEVLYNLYGSTEVSAVSIATPADLRRAPNCAGRAPHGTRLAIFGARGEPLPTGRIGRIFVGNDLLFDGYTEGPSTESRDGMLATGDLGHLTPDGLLFVDGREDDMIVSGGENVYPSTVEDVIAELPQVREVTVGSVTDAEYGQRLAAWIVLNDGERLDPDAVREYVRHRLARFSVPRDVHYLAWLPRSATGKVLTRQLRGGWQA